MTTDSERAWMLVMKFFDNEAKAQKWMATPNPLLGDLSPRQMIEAGRAYKLLCFIENAMFENKP